MKPVLVLGAQGQLGCALVERLRRDGVAVNGLSHAECDIADRNAVVRAVQGSRFAVNCAAYTAVDRAQTDADAAYRVNTLGATNVAAACAEVGVALVHLSTDYVFDGESDRPMREDDPARPVNVYGLSKLAGENGIRDCLASHIILRTSWIFSARGQNFVKTVLRLARAQRQLRIVDDQIGGPTWAQDIAQTILDIGEAVCKPGFGQWGTYHFSGAPPVSWYEFARQILAGTDAQVVPVSSKDFPRAARRPLNSVLDCRRIFHVFGIEQPDWRLAVGPVCGELMQSG